MVQRVPRSSTANNRVHFIVSVMGSGHEVGAAGRSCGFRRAVGDQDGRLAKPDGATAHMAVCR